MRIKLTTDVEKTTEHACLAGTEFDAVLIHPRSTTVEFLSESGKALRAFSYEYEVVDSVE